MKKTLLLAGVACLFTSQTMALNMNPYVSAKLKYSIMDNSAKSNFEDEVYSYKANWDIDDKVFGGSVALGIQAPFTNGAIRGEFEYSLNADAEKNISFTGLEGYKFKTKLKSQTLLFNAYYDVKTNTNFVPYIGAGLGAARLKASLEGESASDTTFAWQIGGGVAYNINENLAVDLGYRYINSGDINKTYIDEDGFPEKDKLEAKAHEIMLGLRYNF